MSINMLCVDDDISSRRSIQMYFQNFVTPNVDMAENYASALQKIKETKYDMIVMDGLSGKCFELYQDIENIPHGDVIILSADDENGFVATEAKRRKIPFYSKLNGIDDLDKIAAYMSAKNSMSTDTDITQ